MPIGPTWTVRDADREVGEMDVAQLERLITNTPIDTSKGWEALPNDARLALRAQNELAKRGRLAMLKARQEEEAARSKAQQDQAVRGVIGAFKQQARLRFPGTDAQFEAAWPAILQQHQVSAALEGANTAVARKRASGDYAL